MIPLKHGRFKAHQSAFLPENFKNLCEIAHFDPPDLLVGHTTPHIHKRFSN